MINETVRHPFEPVYDKTSRTLILGTMPSPASRKNNFYYTHPRNRFWQILSLVYSAPFPETIDDKICLILKNSLALWDVLASCGITGAADSSINKAKPNDFSVLFAHAQITRVLCNGSKAASLYQKLCRQTTGIDAVTLPSTSPANQRISSSELTAIWRAALMNNTKAL